MPEIQHDEQLGNELRAALVPSRELFQRFRDVSTTALKPIRPFRVALSRRLSAYCSDKTLMKDAEVFLWVGWAAWPMLPPWIAGPLEASLTGVDNAIKGYYQRHPEHSQTPKIPASRPYGDFPQWEGSGRLR